MIARLHSRRGSALIVAMIVVTTVALLSVGMLRIMNATTSRQRAAADDRQAFYLAEAGLSEAYASLATGGNGTIGSLAAPALYGGGLVWVEATEPAEGEDPDLMTLTSTALWGRGRSSLEIVVRRVEKPFGIFADEEIVFTDPFLLDGYDSETSDYFEQAGLPALVVDATLEYKYAPEEKILWYDGWYYQVESFVEPDTYYWLARFQQVTTYVAIDSDDAALNGGSPYVTETITEDAPMVSDASSYDYHTEVGGTLGSNGPIDLSPGTGTVEVYGNVEPGVGLDASLGAGVSVTGEVAPREEALALAPVDVPPVTMMAGFEHSDAIPRVLPAADVGYDFITVGPNAELVVQGPNTLVIGDLVLEPSSKMTVDNLTGAVNLYVTNSARLNVDSWLEVLGDDPADLSIQIAGDVGPIELFSTSEFRGIVYGPEAEVSIGSDFEIFGALAGRRLTIAPYSKLHFDSGVLGDSGAVPLPRFIGWSIEELPRVVQNRTKDPFELLAVDKSTLSQLGEERQADSWLIAGKTWQGKGKFSIYEGPAEGMPTPADLTEFIIWEATPPEVGAADWSVYVRYKDYDGVTREYTGGIAGLVDLGGFWIYAWDVTAPEGV